MKTTIEIPDELFKRANAPMPRTDPSGWRSVFGLADPKAVAKVDQCIDADLERTDPSEGQ